MWKRACPDTVAFVTFDSVSETLGFDRAGSAHGFRRFDSNRPSAGVRVVLGEENFGYLLTGNTANLINSFCEGSVGQVLSGVHHNLIVEEKTG